GPSVPSDSRIAAGATASPHSRRAALAARPAVAATPTRIRHRDELREPRRVGLNDDVDLPATFALLAGLAVVPGRAALALVAVLSAPAAATVFAALAR